MLKRLLVLLILSHTSMGETSKISYSYADNFHAQLSIPTNTKPPYPTIIYNYDEYHDWAGPKLAKKLGYHLSQHHQLFNQWGFATLIPTARYRKLNAIKGALQYTETATHLNASDIYIIGVGEGAILSLLAASRFPNIKKIILISPRTINTTGYLSFPNIVRLLPTINHPIYIFVSTQDKRWQVQQQYQLIQLLKQHNKSVSVIPYGVSKKWFWKTNRHYIHELKRILNVPH